MRCPHWVWPASPAYGWPFTWLQRAIGPQQDLARGRAAVVARGERGAIGAGLPDRDQVATVQWRQQVLTERVGGLAHRSFQCGVQQVSPARAALRAVGRALAGSACAGVPAAVESGPDELGHPGVEDDLLGAVGTRPGVQHAGHQPAGRADQVAAGLDGRAGAAVQGFASCSAATRASRNASGPGRAAAGQRKPAAEVDRVQPARGRCGPADGPQGREQPAPR